MAVLVHIRIFDSLWAKTLLCLMASVAISIAAFAHPNHESATGSYPGVIVDDFDFSKREFRSDSFSRFLHAESLMRSEEGTRDFVRGQSLLGKLLSKQSGNDSWLFVPPAGMRSGYPAPVGEPKKWGDFIKRQHGKMTADDVRALIHRYFSQRDASAYTLLTNLETSASRAIVRSGDWRLSDADTMLLIFSLFDQDRMSLQCSLAKGSPALRGPYKILDRNIVCAFPGSLAVDQCAVIAASRADVQFALVRSAVVSIEQEASNLLDEFADASGCPPSTETRPDVFARITLQSSFTRGICGPDSCAKGFQSMQRRDLRRYDPADIYGPAEVKDRLNFVCATNGIAEARMATVATCRMFGFLAGA